MKKEIIIVKVGTQTMLQENGLLDLPQLNKLMNQIIALENHGFKVILVSSGAVAAGKSLQLDVSICADPVQEKQVLASLGQAMLMQQYNTLLKFYDYTAAQVLLTKMDFVSLTHRQNIYRAIHGLLKLPHCLPIINENDTTAIEELMFTDNDELTALLAILIKAKYMVLLTGVDGVYERHPSDKEAKIIHKLSVDEKINVNNFLSKSDSGRGGMASKISACQQAAANGIKTYIANARVSDVLIRLIHQKEPHLGTQIISDSEHVMPEDKISLDFGIEPSITIAHLITESSKTNGNYVNIYPSNISAVEGTFDAGEIIAIKNNHGKKIGVGIAEYHKIDLLNKINSKDESCFIAFNKIVLFKH